MESINFNRYGIIERGCEQFGYSEVEAFLKEGDPVAFNTLNTESECIAIALKAKKVAIFQR